MPSRAPRCTGQMIARSILAVHDVDVTHDDAWQQRARLHQSLWRQAQGLPAGDHGNAPLGSRLAPVVAEPPTLANYLSPQAKSQVLEAVTESTKTRALLLRPRLWDDLLSSQPLCFNLFGPLAEDLSLATTTLSLLWPDIKQVTDIRFEWSPGRDDARYTGNRSAFDVFVAYTGSRGRSFLGIEVKYHEDLSGIPASDPDGRYPRIASRHKVFREDRLTHLSKLPLQQIWLDHLLALQLRANPGDGWDGGSFVLLYPVGNLACATVAADYRRCLSDEATFDVRTLDDLVHAARLSTTASWPDDVYARYLDPAPVTHVLHTTTEASARATIETRALEHFQVFAPADGTVEAGSDARLPFEPTGWRVVFRRELARACRNLTAAPDQLLHAVYRSADPGLADIENILCYNLGPGALRGAAHHGLILERSYTPHPAAAHHYRYELVPDDAAWAAWRAGDLLASINLVAPDGLFADPKAGQWWLAAHRGTITDHIPGTKPPDRLALSLVISPPDGWRGSLPSLLKPLVDGLVSALHQHTGPLDAVLERAGTLDANLTGDEMERLLTQSVSAPLGAVKLVVPWRSFLQWLPADDRIVVLDVRLATAEPSGTVRARAHRVVAVTAPDHNPH